MDESPFDVVALIVNRSSKDAAGLMRRVEKHLPEDLEVLTFRTRDMSHAEQEVSQLVHEHERPLIISVSGDGGANHVYSTAFRAKLQSGHSPVVALLPAGDANDHYQSVFRGISLRRMIKLILAGETRPLDLIRIQIGDSVLYAHSYAAAGGFQAHITAHYNRMNEQAREEGKRRLGLPRQMLEIGKQHKLAKPFRVRWPDGTIQELLNLSIHNVDGMAKVTHPAPKADPSDGRLDLCMLLPKRMHFVRVVGHGIKSTARLVKAEQLTDDVVFTMMEASVLQFDGEDHPLWAGCKVTFSCIPAALHTLAFPG